VARRIHVRKSTPHARTMVWVGIETGANKVGIAAATAILLSSANATLLGLRPFTVVRSRGQMLVVSDQVVATEEPQLAFGMMIVSDTAAALGITAVPDPISNIDGDWFVFENILGSIQIGSSGAGFHSAQIKEFDSKAMRKVGLDEDIVLVGANNSSGDGSDVIVGGRMLLKLH